MASVALRFFKKLDNGQVPPKKIKKKSLSVNHVLFLLFYLLTFEDKNDRLS
jgi:hypothetical protein